MLASHRWPARASRTVTTCATRSGRWRTDSSRCARWTGARLRLIHSADERITVDDLVDGVEAAPRRRHPAGWESSGCTSRRGLRADRRLAPRARLLRPRRGGARGRLYLGYGLSQVIRRDRTPPPPEPCPLPLAACVLCAALLRPAGRGLPRRMAAHMGRGAARGRGRGGAARDRARRRLPGQPGPAPACALRGDPTALAARLRPFRPLAPEPFRGDNWTVVSASPELFLAVVVGCMPIKGTRPAGHAEELGHRRRTPPST